MTYNALLSDIDGIAFITMPVALLELIRRHKDFNYKMNADTITIEMQKQPTP